MSALLPVIALALIGLVAGVGITAIGPGGVLVTIGLVALTPLAPDEVAGTAMLTNVATGIVGTIVFARSRHLADPDVKRLAVVLSVTAVVGTPLGVLLNRLLSPDAFGMLLAALVVIVAVLVLVRQHRSRTTDAAEQHAHARRPLGLAPTIGIGLAVAAVSGVFGVGGPMLSVPLLIVIGVSLLPALAASQVQSIVIAAVGSLGYLASGSIDLGLAALVGLPELLGVVLGWIVARHVSSRVLAFVLAAVLLATAPYIALAP
ncbi:hypothetical protein SAMN04489806_1471 [Paramicrobacterium humi]|uniref:Probable membrane transporter protein n=1 Tax=Paramicrobacterium humi TaxID=640635 RepID=A0A1H4LAV3_9MICO|nr:sulfite exporter TauE/SafE family protein [Microbacterium humi]SEB67445.1 hypothetical protein SAMN04489806_1471 [Microbacterium humi]